MYNFEEKRSSLIATLVMLFIAIHEIKNEDSFLHENILSRIQRNYELDDIEDKIINQAEDAYKRLYDSIEDKELKKKVKERKNEIIDFYNKVKDEIPEYQDWFYEAVMGEIENETGFTTTTLIEKKTAEVEKSIYYYDYVENENANGVSFQCADYYEIGERAYNGDKDAQEKVIDVFATWSILASERIRTSNSELMESDLKDNLTIGHLKNSILIGLTLYESGWGHDGMEELRERNNLGGMNWGFISSVDFNKDLTVDCYKLNPNYDELAPEYYLSIKPEEILPYWTTYASPDDERYIVYVDNGNSLKYWRGYEDVRHFMEDQQRFLLGKNPAIADPNLSAKEILTKYAETFDTYGTGAKNILRMVETYNLERFDKPEVIAQYLNQEGTRIKKVNFETYSFSDEELSKLAALIEAKEGATIYNMRLYTNIILNYFENELDGQFNGAKGKEGLESYIFSPDGFFEDIKLDDLNETSENLPEYKEAIKSVLEGKRVLPGNIRKYASISEIERINTKGKEYTKGEDIINHLESGKTIVYLKDGTKYVYYDIGLPTYFVIPGGDKPEEGEAWYDIMNGELHLYGETYNISGIEGETK